MTAVDRAAEQCTVAIVGGGTAGLAAAAELMRLSAGKVVVLERESQAGGIPRHCSHYPFGLREYKRLLKGPAYAKRNREIAAGRGAELRTGTTVTALHPGGRLDLTTAYGTSVLQAERVLLCTGVRESSRAQRFIGGDRPAGVISTGALQAMIYLKGMRPFQRPIILGSELVSFSAVQTCAHLGISPVAMIEEADRLLARRLFHPYLLAKGVPFHAGVRDPRIIGTAQVEALEFGDANGMRQRLAADGIIVSGRFRPEAALLHASHLDIDPGTGGPVIDQYGRCSDPVYFCTGNLLRPAETASFCWHEGVATARRIIADLQKGAIALATSIAVVATDPAIRFVLPQRLSLSDRPGGMKHFYFGLDDAVQATLYAHYGASEVWRGRLRSRPVRRIQTPMVKLAATSQEAELKFSIKR